MKRLNNIIFLLLSFGSFTQAQTLTLDRFLRQIEENHPIVKQADLKIGQSRYAVLAAKGIFDPQLNYSFDSKKLLGDTYYNLNTPELSLFTPIGLKVKMGMENASGKYLNAERTSGNLSYFGLEMPLLKDFILDKKRATLKQAAVLVQSNEVDKRNALNDLFLSALSDYYEWARNYQQILVLEKNLNNAQERFQLTKVLEKNGDKSGIDTTEALSQLISIQLMLENSFQSYNKSAILLSSYVWDQNGEPMLLTNQTIPDTLILKSLPSIPVVESLIQNIDMHPQIRFYDLKRNQLEIEQRLKKQALMPDLRVKMNLLSKDYYSFEPAMYSQLNNNYKIGLSLNVPLLFREGRGEYQKSVLKLKENDWLLKQKNWDLETKIRGHQAEILALAKQIKISEQLLGNYESLLNLEEIRFSQGESSLFIINSRQNKSLEAQLKLVELKNKYLQTWFKQQWAAGIINN
ncbi:TolC family protein [Lacihabitans sp. LS3-19]|uniref:TolC family protein n=1 Tax=Lacihabitans sp. LS3-19 TaxID=2487335 RepID=UPI0020CE5142|nr:TolC family protein [Lacihabitans sp. LS3-19]